MTQRTRASTWSAWMWIPPALSSLVALIAFSSWNRPLLYDEFVYFMAGPLTFDEVLGVIRETTTNVNQGVTGAYLLSDWFLLQMFGAAPWALRLPSLLFGGALFAYSFVFLRQRGMGWWALTLFPVFLVTQELVMHYVGEARTYLPLAAATVGLLAYYSAPREFKASRVGMLLGWSAAIIGVLFHPYFAIYWPVVLLFGYLLTHRARDWHSLVQWANPGLVAAGALIYILIAAATWARGRATAFVDPYNFLPRPLPIEIGVQNVYAYVTPAMATLVLVALAASAILALAGVGFGERFRSLAKKLLPPVSLYLAAFVIALVVSLSSIVADFWIFPRQWIASTALMAIAIFWGGYLLQQAASRVSNIRGAASGLLLSTAIVVPAATVLVGQAQDLAAWSARPPALQDQQQRLAAQLRQGESLTDGEWMTYAQANADAGGFVWPEFRSYYLETDWSQFVLRD